VAAALNKRQQLSVPRMFGALKNTTSNFDHHGIQNRSNLNRLEGALREFTAGATAATSAAQSAPLGTPVVAGSLAVVGTLDLQVNELALVTGVNAWLAGTVITNCVLGINAANSTGASPQQIDFYGGVYVLGKTPTADERARVQQYLYGLAGITP